MTDSDAIRENEEQNQPVKRKRSGAGIRANKIRQNIDLETEEETEELGFSRKKDFIDDEEENEREFRPARRKVRKIIEEENSEEAEYSKGAPILVKTFAWISLVGLLFAIGYGGANYVFSWLDRKNPNRVGNVIATREEAVREVPSTAVSAASEYTLYIPSQDGSYIKRDVKIPAGTKENGIMQIADMYLNSLKETKTITNDVKINNVFVAGDWVYVDFNKELEASLSTLSAKDGTIFISGLLKTLKENFAPVRKIKIYINSAEATMKTPVNITQPWELNE